MSGVAERDSLCAQLRAEDRATLRKGAKMRSADFFPADQPGRSERKTLIRAISALLKLPAEQVAGVTEALEEQVAENDADPSGLGSSPCFDHRWN